MDDHRETEPGLLFSGVQKSRNCGIFCVIKIVKSKVLERSERFLLILQKVKNCE